MPDARSTKLAAALGNKALVRFTRSFEEASHLGYVLDIGPRWFLMALVGGGLSDVRGLQVPHKYASFVEAALRKRRERLPKKPRVSVESVEELLLSANRPFRWSQSIVRRSILTCARLGG
jgi:hypothetical protein